MPARSRSRSRSGASALTTSENSPANRRRDQEKLTKLQVFLFYPNLIGYLRLFLAIVGFVFAAESWPTLVLCYGISEALDGADGVIARAFGQATLFGAVLDQLTDRLSTVALIIFLVKIYPQYTLGLILVTCIDIGGHWLHTLASSHRGASSHKVMPDGWPLLRQYYQSRLLMTVCHAGNEIVWVALYMLGVLPSATPQCLFPYIDSLRFGARYILLAALPFCAIKQITNAMQVLFGAKVLADLDVERRSQSRK